MGVNVQQGRATSVDAIPKRGLDQVFVVQASALFNFDDQMRTSENSPILADKVVFTVFVCDKLKLGCRVDNSAALFFRMGA